MTRFPFIPSAIFAAASITQAPRAEGYAAEMNASPAPVPDTASEVSCEAELVIPDDSDNSACALDVVTPIFPEWTARNEKRFLKLAEMEALKQLTPETWAELESLSSERYRLKTPRSGQQVLLEYEQRKISHDLIQALERYVAFQKATRRPHA
jgi:hypothetical protein